MGILQRAGAVGKLVLVLLLAFGLSACDSPQERAEKHFQRGVALLQQGQENKARLEFRNAIRVDRNHAGARYEIGRLAEEGGNLRAALGQYREVANLDPSHVGVRVKIAQILMLSNELDEARSSIEQAFALEPGNAEVLATMGALQYRLGNVERGLQYARDAIAVQPDTVSAHAMLISDLVAGQRFEEALRDVDTLLARLPRDEVLNVLKLRILIAQRDEAGLEQHLTTLVGHFPDRREYRQALTQIYLTRGDTERAEQQLRLAAGPGGDTDAALALIRFLLAVKGEAAARAEIESRIAAAPNPAGAMPFRIALSELHWRAGRTDEARATLEQAIAVTRNPEQLDRARIQLARYELAQGKGDAARQLAEQVLERDRDNVDALSIRAATLIDAYRPEDAILDIRRALNAEPQNPQLMLLEARAHERSGNLALAGERLQAATRASGFDPAIAGRYVTYLQGRNRLNAAETILEETDRRHPGNPAILEQLVRLRLSMGDTAGAEAATQRLRATEAGRGTADRLQAAMLVSQGRTQESVALLERVVAEGSDNQRALSDLVVAYVRTGETARAVSLLDRLIAENPANVRALALRAELHLIANELEDTEARLRDIVVAAPRAPTGYVALSRFFRGTGRPADAERILRAGLDANPDAVAVRLTLAELLEQRGAFDEAIAEYRRLYETNSDVVVVANNLASLLAEFKADDPEVLAEAARIARRLKEADVPHFLDTYGWIAFLNGNMDEALATLERAAEALPNLPLVRYHLGRVYAAAGRADQARAELEAALSIDPAFPKADSARAVIASLPANGG